MEALVAGRILVADDLPQNVELLEAQLVALGHSVVTASDGREALRKAYEEVPDLILLDVLMPGLDGYAVCRRLKAEATTASVPVLIVTALSGPDEVDRAMEAGADDLLGKPFSGRELMIQVRSLLRLKQLGDQVEAYRRMATVGEMASGIAHEMRNPLAITSSAAQILLKKGTNPRLRQECAEKIHTAADRTAAIIEQLVRFTRSAGALRNPPAQSGPLAGPVDRAGRLETAGVQA